MTKAELTKSHNGGWRVMTALHTLLQTQWCQHETMTNVYPLNHDRDTLLNTSVNLAWLIKAVRINKSVNVTRPSIRVFDSSTGWIQTTLPFFLFLIG